MRLRRFATICTMLLVAAGLLLAPLAAPVMATAMSNADTMDAHSMSMADEMAGDMPCCPGETKGKTCDSCPFVALCMLSITMPPPDGGGVLAGRTFALSVFAPPDDLLIDGLGEHPPDHPPRTDV